MYNHTVTRLAYRPICFIMFVSGICIGTLLGLLFILMDQTAVGILAGTFIALITGLYSAFFGLIYTVIFNLLAPAMGGIPLEISPLPSIAKKDEITQVQDSTL